MPKTKTNRIPKIPGIKKLNEDKYKGFKIVRKTFTSFGQTYKTVHFVTTDDYIKGYIGDSLRLEAGYEYPCSIEPMTLVRYLDRIENDYKRDPVRYYYLKDVIKFLNIEMEHTIKMCQNLKEDGNVTYDTLWYFIKVGMDVQATLEDEIYSGKVIKLEYQSGWTGRRLQVVLSVIDTDGKNFFQREENVEIRGFDGTVPFNTLEVQPLKDDVKAILVERGRVFTQYGLGANYVSYSGYLLKRSWFGNLLYNSEGRIIIDAKNYERQNKNSACSPERDKRGVSNTIDEDCLHLTFPFLKGFSFRLKTWGEMAVSKMSEIVFNDTAFETLVLDPKKKAIVSSLVNNADNGFKDIIENKSGGVIFLLHGTPGTGKTLTAEAIAEKVHRPLYSVSVGELGITPSELEGTLRTILEMASLWNAVVLIDEADIYLEKHDEHNILRNAMVGIFLRLLEYHQGILFLTTNRVKQFDDAFHSRISVAMNYKPHNEESRAIIWTNLLKAAGITGLDVKELAKHDINGRQIKNAIRLAQSFAKDNNEVISMNHVNDTIKLQCNFIEDVNEKKENK